MEPLYLAAEAADPQNSVLGVFLQYGAIGAIAAVSLWFAYTLIKREQKRADDLADEVSRLNKLIVDSIYPQTGDAVRAVKDVTVLLQQMLDERRIEKEVQERLKRRKQDEDQ